MAAARKRKHNLVIVESPAKVKTIKKFLGSKAIMMWRQVTGMSGTFPKAEWE